MKEKTEIIKKELSLNELPHKGKLINWKESVGKFVNFTYGDIKGSIEIVDYFIEENKIKTKYKDIEYITTTSNFQKIKISNCLGIKRKNNKRVGFKYSVGDIVDTNNGKIKIIKQIRWGEKGIRSYEYECLIDGDKDTIRECNLIKGSGCKVCSNRKIVKGINDITTTHPHLIKYFDNIEDAYTNTYGTHKKVLFKCLDCGYKKEIEIVSFVKQGFNCPKCGDCVSIPQKIVFNILEQLDLNFETEYNPKWIKPKRFDFYIPSINKIIEADGGWHNKDNNRSGQTKEESKAIDKYKDELANEHGIEVIRIDLISSELEYIKEKLLNHKRINELFNLSKIDWVKCYNFALSSRIKEACNYKNNNPSLTTRDISKIMKMSQSGVLIFLKKGREIGLCDYDEKEERIKGGKIKSKKVICLDDGLSFYSANEAGRFYNCHGTKVSSVCRGERKSTNGLHFVYCDEYNNIEQ